MRFNKDVNYKMYLISDRDILKGRDLLVSLEEAILGGVSVIQLREKDSSSLEFYEMAIRVKKLTKKYDIPLIINDRLDIALAVDADGVHLGQSDLPARVARELLGQDKILGVSTANVEEAEQAVKDGADYIGVGALFPTKTKSNTRCVTLEELTNIKNKIDIPVVAIGGINEKNIHFLKKTKIDGCAVVSAILGKKDIKQATKDLLNIF